MATRNGLPIEFGGGDPHAKAPDTGKQKFFIKFTPADPQQPIPVDTLIGFLQAALNDFFYTADISGKIEISHIGGDIFIVGASGEAVKA